MTDATSTSTQDVISSVIFNGVICAIFVTGFFLLRLKIVRIYEPKSKCDILPEEERPEPLPLTPLFWFKALITKEPSFIIQYSGIDGYLFIRYLFLIASYGLGGIFLWIILFPVNATNGKGQTGLNQLSISNVGSVGRYYAHVFMSWIYYSCIMFTIYRELHFYTNLRNLLLTTPYYAKKLSSRVVLFQTVPSQYLDENEFSKLFGGVKKIWVAKVSKKLSDKVNQRIELVDKLENQLNKILKNAVKIKMKSDKKGETIEPENELVCYIPQKKMPTIRLKKFIGKKVDFLSYCKEKISELNSEILELQDIKNVEHIKPLNTIAVEFENQYYAQLAYQVIIHDQPLHFTPKHIGVKPDDIFWPNLRMFWWERIVRFVGAIALIIFLIIIWAIPVAFVGFISNLTYLTNKLPWLKFIYNLPDVLLGLITALLPTVLLAILMMCLPIFIRSMAKLSGCLTTQSVEYFTQNAYFAFQVVQSFLVVTIASSVSTVVTQIIEDPTSAMSLLSTNLPKTSNFFISYMILNGFTISGGSLFQIVPLILFYIMSFILDNTVRKKYNRNTILGGYSWGTTYPLYSLLGIVSLTYSIISPIISLFTFFSFLFLYLTFMNNSNYISSSSSDSLGKNYPRALFQLMVGIYFGEVCLLGLFAVSKSWGCIVLEAIFIGITVIFHIQMNNAFDKLLTIVPNTCMRPLDGKSETLSWKDPRIEKIGNDNLFEDNKLISNEYKEKLCNEPLLIEGDRTPIKKPNFVLRWIQPWKYLTYHDLKEYIPNQYWEFPKEEELSEVEYMKKHEFDYECPYLKSECPTVWIPKDPMGLSTIQIEEFKGIVPISDCNATFDDKGKIIYTGPPPTLTLKEQLNEEDKKDEIFGDVNESDYYYKEKSGENGLMSGNGHNSNNNNSNVKEANISQDFEPIQSA